MRAPALCLLAARLAGQSFESVRPPGSLELAAVVHDDRALSGAHDVALQGNFAFVAGKGGSLAIVDVANPRQPRLASFLHDPGGLEDAETVLPLGDVLLLGTRDLVELDIRDPARPGILKKISQRPAIDSINGMALRGNHVLAANKRGHVAVFDVSNPADPVYRGSVDTQAAGGPVSPHDIAVVGDHAVVVDAARDRPSNVYVCRVAHAGTHELLEVSRWTVEGSVPNATGQRLAGANRVALWRGYGAADTSCRATAGAAVDQRRKQGAALCRGLLVHAPVSKGSPFGTDRARRC